MDGLHQKVGGAHEHLASTLTPAALRLVIIGSHADTTRVVAQEVPDHSARADVANAGTHLGTGARGERRRVAWVQQQRTSKSTKRTARSCVVLVYDPRTNQLYTTNIHLCLLTLIEEAITTGMKVLLTYTHWDDCAAVTFTYCAFDERCWLRVTQG